MFNQRAGLLMALAVALIGGAISPLLAREFQIQQPAVGAWSVEPVIYNGVAAVGVSDNRETVVIAIDQLGTGQAQVAFSLGLAPGGIAPEPGTSNARVIVTPSRLTLQRDSGVIVFSVMSKDSEPTPPTPVVPLLALVKGTAIKAFSLSEAVEHYLKPENRPVKRPGEPDYLASCASKRTQLIGLVAALNPFGYANLSLLDPCTAGGPGSGSCSIGGCEPQEGPTSCSVGQCEKGFYACCWCAPEARCHCVQDVP